MKPADLPGLPEGTDPPDIDGGFDIDAVPLPLAMQALAPTPSDIPLGSEPSTPEWDKYLQLEQTVLDAEWECAEPVYEAGMKVMPEVIDQFQKQHATDIDTMIGHWAQTMQQASRLGWSPDRPFAAATPQ